MKSPLLLTYLAAGCLSMVSAATFCNLSTAQCDESARIIYDGKGNFAVQSGAETSTELTINLNSFLSYTRSNDYKIGNPLLLWDADLVDYGLTDLIDPEGKPAITGYWFGKLWPDAGLIEFDTLQQYADEKGEVTLIVTNSSTKGVSIRAKAADGSTPTLYQAPALRAAGNKTLTAYRLNLNYATALTIHTPSTLDISTYTPPPDYTHPFISKRPAGSPGLGRVMFMGDSITHGVNDKTWRWQLYKILVDNGIEAEIVGPRSGYTPGYARLTTPDTAETYGNSTFPNVHLAQSSGRTHNIISGSNAGMSGVNYGGHSTSGTANAYNCDTWCCLMGTNDLLSDRGYTPLAFAVKMHNLLGGEIRAGRTYRRIPDGDWGNMGKIATDVLRDKGDILYVMSVPCWGRHHNNNQAERHSAVECYNTLLAEWVEDFSKAHKLNLRYVDINRGMVDPTAATPFTWPDSMSNRPGADGLHPNAQGSLIIAGNLARAMGLGGRTAGLTRANLTSQAIPIKRHTIKRLNKSDRQILPDSNTLNSQEGYTIELQTKITRKSSLRLTLADGTNSGTLSVEEGRICWDNSPLYCDSKLQGNIRIVRHKGSPTHNIMSGYYIWLDDMLIGQGLTPSGTTTDNGLSISGKNKAPSDIILLQTAGAYAPATTGKSDPAHAFILPQK